MKFCVSGRQSGPILQKSDEIKVETRDFRIIPEYVERFPGKQIILVIDRDKPADFNWSFIETYKDQICCALKNLEDYKNCSSRGIRFYYYFSVNSLFEVQSLAELGVCYIMLGTPLMFQLDEVKKCAVPARAIANLAYEPYLIKQNGIIGGWIRPEDVGVYDEWIEVLEFYAGDNLDREATLFNVYAEKGTWPGNLNLLIENLNFDVDNRLIYDEDHFAKRRATCQQKCLSNGTCHFCEQRLKFVDNILTKYQDLKRAT